MFCMPVGGEALKAADGDTFALYAAGAKTFTLGFLRADTAANCGEAVCFGY